MEIKNWIEAIDLTIERHQAVLDKKQTNYGYATKEMKHNDWKDSCPLCEFLNQSGEKGCKNCIWIKFSGNICARSLKYNYRNDKQSVKRLNEWKRELTKISNPSNGKE